VRAGIKFTLWCQKKHPPGWTRKEQLWIPFKGRVYIISGVIGANPRENPIGVRITSYYVKGKAPEP